VRGDQSSAGDFGVRDKEFEAEVQIFVSLRSGKPLDWMSGGRVCAVFALVRCRMCTQIRGVSQEARIRRLSELPACFYRVYGRR
jgi:hypothetical protein